MRCRCAPTNSVHARIQKQPIVFHPSETETHTYLFFNLIDINCPMNNVHLDRPGYGTCLTCVILRCPSDVNFTFPFDEVSDCHYLLGDKRPDVSQIELGNFCE